jgi:hypothetical protein
MVLKALAAPLMVAHVVVGGAFTAGALAGAAGVVGICALRRRLKEKKAETSGEGHLPAA